MEGGVPTRGTAFSVPVSSQNRDRMKLSAEVDDGHERIGEFVGDHLYAGLVRHIDQELGE